MKPIILLLTFLVACQGSTTPPDELPLEGQWSAPVALFEGGARMASGAKLHAVANIGGAVVHRSSDDEGATWSGPTVIPGTTGLEVPLYGPIAVNGSMVHVLTRGDGNIRMWRSTDGGATWSSGTILSGYTSDASDRVHIDTDGDYVHVFIGRAGATPDATFKNYYWRSTDQGVTWSGVTVLDDASGPPSPGGIDAENGTVHIAYAAIVPDVGTLGHRARYIRSTDNGASWSAPVDVSGGSTKPQIRPRPLVADGRVLVLWEEPLDHDPYGPLPNATRGQIRANRSVDNGATWQGTFDVTAISGQYPNHPIVGAGPGPLMHVAYRLSQDQATLTPSDKIGYRLSTDYGATWRSHEEAVDLPTTETHPYNIVATDGFVHVMVGGSSFYHARRDLPEAP